MTGETERKGLVKVAAAGAAPGTFIIATGFSPFSYAKNSKVSVGCIGVGGQGCFHIRQGLMHNPEIQIVAIADVFRPNQVVAQKLAMLSNAKQYVEEGADPTPEQIVAAEATAPPALSYNYREVLSNPDVDAVVISTPLNTHFQIAMEALDAGKYVFCEKTLVKTIEEGRALVTRCHELNRWVQVGHQRRYNPKYNLAQWMTFDKGMLGRITHITSQWHRNVQWRKAMPVNKDGTPYWLNDEERKYIPDLEKHLNWRLYDEVSGGLFTELATHQTDISNWFLRALPSRVCTMGGIDYWRDGRTADDNIVIVYEYNLKRTSPGFIAIKPRTQLMDLDSANRPYTVRFVYTSILSAERKGCFELIQGDRGSLELTEDVCKYSPEPQVISELEEELIRAYAEITFGRYALVHFSDGQESIFRKEALAAMHNGRYQGKGAFDVSLFDFCDDLNPKHTPSAIPDALQFKAFTDCIRNGGIPRNNQMVGFTAAITALAAMQSRKEGVPVDIDPAWYAFDFEVPSFYEYDPSWGSKKCEERLCPCCGKPMPKEEELEVARCQVCGQKLPKPDKGEVFVPCPAQNEANTSK